MVRQCRQLWQRELWATFGGQENLLATTWRLNEITHLVDGISGLVQR
jgi:hypothetical protein